ncbi:MAG: hypothetical protein HWD84_02275 [Flavobacteriaceae bacterium]|nr:hypothetical protein [Flavobacteriaceae bacterium]
METEFLHKAFKTLKEETALDLRVETHTNEDGTIDIVTNDQLYTFFIDIKKEPRQHHINTLINEARNRRKFPCLLVAHTIFPKLQEQLKEHQVNYLDLQGNAFLKNNNLFIYIQNQKKKEFKEETGNRAFTKTGLKVLFHLLINPNLINENQRTIKEETDVALGNIPKVLNGLKETGHLLDKNKNEFLLINKKELIDRWVEGYETRLKPGLKKRTFEATVPWQEIQLNEKIAVWGGEPGADLLTHYLRPEKYLLYTNEDQANLIRNYKLKPKTGGNVEVCEMFWNTVYNQATAPPLLIYADLMIEGGKRNIETAKKIYHEYIEPQL